MGFYLHLIRRLAHLSFLRQAMYKTDFFFYGFTIFTLTVVQIAFLYVLFALNHNTIIAGFSREEMLFVYIFSQWIYAFFFTFIADNIKQLGSQLTRGEIDFYFLMPGRVSFHLIFQKISFRNIISMLLINICASFLLAPQFHMVFSLWEWAYLLWIFISSIWLLQMIYLLAISCLFFFHEMWGPWNFLNSVRDISRNPQTIYPSGVQLFFMTLVPFFMVITPVFTVLHHEYSMTTFLEHVLFVLGYSLVSIGIWKKAVKHYESGN